LKYKLWTAALAVAFALTGAAPALAVPAMPNRATIIQYTTRIVPQLGVGEYDGRMTLTLNSNGIVNGTYIPDSGGPRVVTGGFNGDQVWLDFGFMGKLHMTGKFKNGRRIVGHVFIGTKEYRFIADVRPH
jgi:hypothetical protein